MHSVSDLTTFCRSTSGDVPPKLVGSSNTVVGSKMYLYGGRLVTERRMVTDMFVFDIKTLVWEKIPSQNDENTPDPRYFHSADTWNQYLIIFGGMGLKPEADNADDLCVLNDVRFYDLAAKRWMPPSWSLKDAPENLPPPKARYAHLSSVSGDRLFIIGGQDLNSVWLDDVYVYDLSMRAWVQRSDYARHCGTYRSVAVSASQRVRLPQEELRHAGAAGPSKPVFRTDPSTPVSSTRSSSDPYIHLPYSAPATDEFPNDIYLYSNYNFTDVQRELEVFSPLPNNDFSITDESATMSGSSFPPGLRFPTGAILGTHLIIAGTYIAHNFQSFSVWALNLIDMTWSRVDPGGTLSTGSWFRSCLWADDNKFLIFGNRQGILVEDYNRRLLSWEHVAIIDLEAFGIYQPPRLELDTRMQEMGVAALEEGVLADFEIVCDDDRRVKCSRKLLEDRWPWFKEQRRLFLQAATRALDTLPLSSTHVALPDVPGAATQEPRPDPRLSPRVLQLSEPYPITLALVQYFYSLALITPLQHAPAVLSALLVLATNYDLPHLRSLVTHAMHRALSNSTSVGVYEVATLCSCRSLQIRALKTVMLYNQKRPSGRSRKDGGGAGRPSDASTHGGGGAGGGAGAGGPPATARPRGMSDALMRPQGSAGPRGNVAQDDPGPSAPGPSRSPVQVANRDGRLSIITLGMDEELAAIAELHSPVIDPGSVVAESESPRVDGLLESLHPLSEEMALTSPRRLRVDTRYATSSRTSPLSSTIFGPSPDLDQYDDVVSMNYLSPVAFHLPRPRQNSFRESDTPSLTSSASRSSLNSYVPSSFLGSPPASPPLNAQVHMPESSHLAAITELQPHGERYRSVEDEEEHKSPVLFSPVSEHPYNDSASTITPHKILARMRSNSDALRRLRTGTPPVDTAQEPLPSSAPSSSGPLQLTRFFSGKSDKPDEDKQRKAEEKRRRKEDAKARTENLALELKRRAEERARKAENASVYSTRSDEKRHRKAAWEEDGAAYSGLATGF